MNSALDLAAARVRALGVHTLAARLDDRFRLLTAGQRGAPARQRTLRAMIDWSWELAAEPERVVLRRLSVHVDGCTLTAAEQTCAGEGLDQAGVADLLARLVDRSLVTVTAEDAREPRYRLLGSVAAYGTERLREAGELDRRQERHRAFYTTLAERARYQLRGQDQQLWLHRLDREAANIHSALEGSFGQRDVSAALRLAGAMTWYWFLCGRLTEARRALSSALALPGPGAALDGSGAVPGRDGSGAGRAFATAWLAGITLLARGSADDARAALLIYGDVDDPGGRAEPADLARPDRDADRRLCAGAGTARGRPAAGGRAGLQAGRGIRRHQPGRARPPGRRSFWRRCCSAGGSRLAPPDGPPAGRREGHGAG